jgi:hypothetical protein
VASVTSPLVAWGSRDRRIGRSYLERREGGVKGRGEISSGEREDEREKGK